MMTPNSAEFVVLNLASLLKVFCKADDADHNVVDPALPCIIVSVLQGEPSCKRHLQFLQNQVCGPNLAG